MAGRRSFTTRKYKAYPTKESTAMQLARQALNNTKRLRGLLNVEYKTFDLIVTGQTLPQTAFVQHISNITQGDTDFSRDGSSVLRKSLYFKGRLTINASATTSNCRVLIVMSTISTAPTGSTIFDTTSGGNETFSFRNTNGTKQMQVLFDKQYILSTVKDPVIPIAFYSKQSKHIQWDSNSTNPKIGHVYVVLVSDEATNYPTIDFESRIRYLDN